MTLYEKKFLTGYKLITIIIKKGLASNLMSDVKKVGVEGNTIVFGKGAASQSVYESILGINYEPEKEIIFVATPSEKVSDVLDIIVKKAKLDKPGNGIAFVLDLNKCLGIAHFLELLN